MTEKELKKLSRSELLEMLIRQVKINKALENKVAVLEAELKNNDLTIIESGTMAEAALKLSGVFEAADKAVAEYKRAVYLKTEKEARMIIEKAKNNPKYNE